MYACMHLCACLHACMHACVRVVLHILMSEPMLMCTLCVSCLFITVPILMYIMSSIMFVMFSKVGTLEISVIIITKTDKNPLDNL